MEYRLVLLVFMLYIAKSRSMDPPTTCTTTADEVKWSTEIIDIPGIDDDGTLNLILPFTGNFDVSTPVGDDTGVKFIDASVEGENIVIKTNSYFTTNFDQDTASTTDAFVTIGRTINIICDGANYPLRLTLYVTDTNNNAPTFVATTYEYTMPMPLMPGIDLTSFGDQLIASDMDFSNQNMTFTIAPLDSFVLTTESLGNKQYRAILKVEQFTRFETDTVLTITATDEEGTKAGTATITIIKDGSASIPDPPTFSEVIYEYTYSEEAGVPTISPVDPTKEIVVTTNDPDNTAATITANDYVTAIYDTATGIVTIASSGTAIVSSEQVLTYTLTLTLNAESTQAAIIVKVPSDIVVSLPIFTQPYYTATYSTASDPHTVALDTNQVVAITEDSPTLQITLEGDIHFSISNVAGVWTLKADSNLEDTVLEKGDDIILTLTATVLDDQSNTYNGSGTVVIQLPEVVEVPRFDYPFYTGTYAIVEGGTDTVTLNHPINIANGVPEEVKISDSVNPYFEITKDTDAWNVTVTTNIPPPLTGGHIVLTLEATTADSAVSGYGTLIINLPSAVQTLTFTKPFYKATYSTLVDPPTVILEEPIAIDADLPNLADLAIILEGDDHFSISNVTGVWTINVETSLEEDILNKGGDVVVTIHGTGTDDQSLSYEGYGTVVITLPEVLDVPRFAQPTYTGTYIVTDSGNPDSVTLDNPINIAQTDETVDIVITDNDNFTLAQEGNDWIVKVATNLDPDVIQNGGSLILTLQATVTTGTIDPGFGTLIINLPVPVQSPTFMQSHYIATYEPGTSPLPMVDGTIQVTAADPAAVTVAIKTGSSHAENFNIVANSGNTGYDVVVVADLDDATLIGEPDVVLTLQATVEGATTIGESTLVINLPKETAPAAFTQAMYTATYVANPDPATDVLTVQDPITISGNYMAETTVTLSSSEYTDYFILTGTNPTFNIQLQKDLDSPILTTVHEIVLTLEATLAGSTLKTTSTVVIQLPEVLRAPAFTNPIYTATYKVVDTTATVTIDDPQINTGASDSTQASVIIKNTFTDNFVIEYVEASANYQITVSKLLDEDVVTNNVEIYLILSSTVTGEVDEQLATVALRMEKAADSVVPKFSDPFYYGTYTQNPDPDPDTITIPTAKLITIASDRAAETAVTAIDTYATNFQPNFDGTSWQITVAAKLDENTLSSSEIVVTLQADLPGSPEKGLATLILALPAHDDIAVPLFDHPLYRANYTVGTDGSPSFSSESIAIRSSQEELVTVTLDAYTANFVIARDDVSKTWTLSLGEPLGDDILKDYAELVITLTGQLDNAVADGTATLVVTLPAQSLSFDHSFYEGTYIHEATKADDVTIGTISVTIGAIVTIDGDHKDNFAITCTDGKCNLTTSGLSDDVLNAESEIILVVTATKPDVSATATATIIISLPLQEAAKAPEFTSPSYRATYNEDGGATVELPVPIQIKGMTDVTGLESIDLIGDYVDNFTITAEGDHFKIDTTGVPQTVIDSEIVIVLTMQAKKTGVTVAGEAALVIELPKKVAPSAIYFETSVYMGDYTDTDGVAVEKVIKLIGDDDHSATVTLSGENSALFENTYNTDGTVTISVVGDILPEAILNANAALTINIDATKGTDKVTAALVVTLPKSQNTDIVALTHVTYIATYSIVTDAADTVEVDNGPITIKDLTDFTNADIKIADDDAYKAYFSLTLDTDHWTLAITQDLEATTTDHETSLLVSLIATVNGISGEAGLVIKLPKTGVTSTLYFDDTVYMSDYDTVHSLVVEKDLTLQGNDDGTAALTFTGEHKDLFQAAYNTADKIVTITVPTAISQQILDDNAAISVGVVATKNPDTAEATLVVRLPKTQGVSSLSFTNLAYVGSYALNDENIGEVTIEGNPIQIVDVDQTTATLTIEDAAYQPYFSFSVDSDHWLVTVEENLPSSITDDDVSIFMTLKATVNDVAGEAGLVLKLPRKVVSTSFYFRDNTYNGEYMVYSSDNTSLVVEKPIQIDGDPDSTVNVTLSGDYAQYFTCLYENTQVAITILESLPSSIVDTLTLISVDLLGTKGEGTSKATLIVKLPEKTKPVTFFFDETTYMADYIATGTPTLGVDDDITLEGDSDGTATVTLNGDYKDNFEAAYNSGKITITLKSPLASDVVTSETAISLEIEASRDNEETKTTLVIKLPKQGGTSTSSSGSDTGLIAAVSVLAVLLVASLVGSAVFYYFKFRRGKNYSDLDEGRPSERFRKNENNPDTKRFEHPTRRATGVIKYPLTDEVAGESGTDVDLAEKRKSVQFDTINIDEREIEKSQDPEDDIEEQEEDEEHEEPENREEEAAEYENLDVDSDENEDIDIRRSSRV